MYTITDIIRRDLFLQLASYVKLYECYRTALEFRLSSVLVPIPQNARVTKYAGRAK